MKKLAKILIKGLLFCLALSLICLLVSCDKREGSAAGSDSPAAGRSAQDSAAIRQQGKPSGQQPTVNRNKKKENRIRGVILSPGIARADSRVTVNTDIFPLLKEEEGEILSYVFYKNTEMLDKQDENYLPPGSVARGDSLFADVILYKNGEEIESKRSSIIFIVNSKPEIGQVEFPEIKGLGTYSIVVNASDADDDNLAFSLDQKYGIPEGMSIDEKNGVITYRITSPPEKDARFKVIVRDEDGGEDWREFSITFSRSMVKRNDSFPGSRTNDN